MTAAGGKGLSLIKLERNGFSVPPFVIVKQNECTVNNLERIIKEKFPTVSAFAVRSSFTEEDGLKKSFAGHFYSALGVSKDNLIKECEKVIDSYNGGSGEVILQEFIPSDSAGVIFSNAGDDKMVINSTFGLCEPVVKGKRCDEYVIDRKNRKVLSELIEKQKETVQFANGKFNYGSTDHRSLLNDQVQEVFENSLKIEKLFGAPQDIEFCYFKNQLLILQSRPITKKIFEDGLWTFYDNANIAESYSGIVFPLTISFVKKLYSEVYKDLLLASGVSRNKIDKNNHIFKLLVGDFYGKLYYNMNSWYKMMSFLPGYNRNKKNLELMISSNTHTEISRDIKPGYIFSVAYLFIVLAKLLIFPLTSSNISSNER